LLVVNDIINKQNSKAFDNPILAVIGVIRSELMGLEAAPFQGDEGVPEAWLQLVDRAAQGLAGITAGDELIVLTWLHHSRRVSMPFP
jgi:tRNA (Thr-GGU) A37 N-methylase